MEDNTQYRPILQGRTGSKAMLFIGGVAIGYAVATLLTPKSGREIRSSLSDYAKATTDSVSGAVRNAASAAQGVRRAVTRRVADALDQGKEKARYLGEVAASKTAAASKAVEDIAH